MSKRTSKTGDDGLWRRVTKDVAPMKRAIKDKPKVEPLQSGLMKELFGDKRDLMGSTAAPSPSSPSPPPSTMGRRRINDPSKPALKKRAGSVANAGDPGRDKLVKRGRMAIDRRLDLHGLTQAVAELQVSRFLEDAHHDGCRCVLIITGKGAPLSGTPIPGMIGGRGRGVLRERITDWLNAPSLRPLVARMSPAAQHDGGSGAFYVFLKQKQGRL